MKELAEKLWCSRAGNWALQDVHASSLYNTGVSGLLVVGTVQTSESDPNNRGISVGNVPTIEEEEDPDPEAEDGQPKVGVWVCVCVCDLKSRIQKGEKWGEEFVTLNSRAMQMRRVGEVV
jgi:hypothetical protein